MLFHYCSSDSLFVTIIPEKRNIIIYKVNYEKNKKKEERG
jgi:hypothetical protein